MLYVDFGKDVVIRTFTGLKQFKRYTAFKNARAVRDVPVAVMFEAHTIIIESQDGSKVEWHKNRHRGLGVLTAEELEQFVWQKLSSEVIG